MAYQLNEVFPSGAVVKVAVSDTFGDILTKVPGEIISYEEDADNPGCWDVMSANRSAARQFTIEAI